MHFILHFFRIKFSFNNELSSSELRARNIFPGPNIGNNFVCSKKELLIVTFAKCFAYLLFYGYKIIERKTRQLAMRIQINEKALNIKYGMCPAYGRKSYSYIYSNYKQKFPE
jgi:hypothetical protein